MPKAKAAPPRKTLVVDNGAYNIKAGFVTEETTLGDCQIVPNTIARSRDRRILVGSQLGSCRDFGGMAFRRPVEKGYLVNWEAEKEIWDHTFLRQDSPLFCDPHETNLLLTEAPNAPASLQANTDQMVFEEYEFAGYTRVVGPSLIPWSPLPTQPGSTTRPAEACIVIDAGYSHTHTIPLIHSHPYNLSIRRIDIAGKFLTNYLKELVSLRSYNMMDETYIINDVKESSIFVSSHFTADLELCKREQLAKNPLALDYVLPDYNAGKGGFARKHVPRRGVLTGDGEKEQVVTLANERFAVPELLFNPSDIGLRQAGVAEAVMQSVEMLPEKYRGVCLANVVLVGGCAKIPGLRERVQSELRELAREEVEVRVGTAEEPEKAVWWGGVNWVRNGGEGYRKRCVTRQEYQEYGLGWVQRKMAGLGTEGAPKDTAQEREKREGRSHKKRRTEA